MKKKQLGKIILQSQETFYRIAKSLLTNDADCEDAMQSMIVKAFDRIDTLKQDRYAKTWLTRILINECYQLLRSSNRFVLTDEWEGWDTAPAENADYSDLYEALQRLPNDMRLAVTLYYAEGYRVREIADILDVSESAVKSRLKRAREKLKNDLTEGKEAFES